MKAKSLLEERKSLDVQCIAAGVIIFVIALTGLLGYESLSVGYVLVFAIFCVLTCMSKDLKELCNALAEEEE